MTAKKIRLGILFGGKTMEHEVSLASARSIIEALDKNKYDLFLIGIDKTGEWHLRDNAQYLIHADDPNLISLNGEKETVALVPKNQRKEIVSYQDNQLRTSLALDVIFPVLHGTYGEDGTIQGLLKLANIPFVGAGVLGSAIAMDKDVMKRLMREAGLPIGKFLILHHYNKATLSYEQTVEKLGTSFFIKPANLGSSVGISKVKTEAEYLPALEKAFLYDRKVIIEEGIVGREIECSVLGNAHPFASLPGELTPQHEFYSYEAKYLDENGALFQIPAILPPEVIAQIQTLAIDAYRTLCCEGLARVDFFLKPNGELLLNEINTLPGFTKISMYPKLWEVSGLPYGDLLDRLIELALERHAIENSLCTSL